MGEEPMKEYRIFRCNNLPICEACLRGEGDECHTPGCLLWLCRCPDLNIAQRIIDYGGEIADQTQLAGNQIAAERRLGVTREYATS